MRILKNFKSTATRFTKDRNGNFALMAGIIVPVIMVAAGFVIDIVQINNTKSALLNALDSAVTSTARDITTGKIQPQDARASVEQFLLANGATGFIDPSKLSLDKLVVNKGARTVEAQASADIQLAFPLFNIDRNQKVTTESAAVYSDKTIEVAMMLDVTGSMNGQKLEDLKTAAKAASKLFLEGQDPNNPRVRVSVVPYANAVNTGALKNTVFVETKGGTNIPPKLTDPIAAAVAPDNCATERKNASGKAPAINDNSPYSAKVNRDDRLQFCPSAALLPLTANQTDVDATIDSFKASGYTAGHIGVQWAWYMLSPKWKDVLTTAQAPGNYNNKKVGKYAILMTDGQFNTAYAGVDDSIVADTQGKQGNKSRDYAEQLCSQMKKKGIEVFTIGFMLNNNQAKKVMQNCASTGGSTQYYFAAANGAELTKAFQEIAANIERLAVTK